jgi:hypothetical protein
MDWSPAILFDPAAPFADVRKDYFPIAITADGWFPVVDELGSPLGLEIQPTTRIQYEALLRIETVAKDAYGVTAQLEIEFDRPGYYNGLRLTPFVNMPVWLTKIEGEGMLTSANATPIFEGKVLIDRPASIRFADAKGNPEYVRRLFLTLYQPNYTLKEHVLNPADQARQDALARLQTVLPFSDRPVQLSLPTSLVGAQYELGLRDIAGERYTPVQVAAGTTGRGVFVSGPFHVDGAPEIIRLDADITGTVDCYPVCRTPGGDVTMSKLVPGTTISFPDIWLGTVPSPADFYLKWVFRSDDAVLTRFLLQVTKGA